MRAGLEASAPVELPLPDCFTGTAKDPSALTDWVYKMEGFFLAKQVPESRKLALAAVRLEGSASSAWRNRTPSPDEIFQSRVKLLEFYFLDPNALASAREELRRCSQGNGLSGPILQNSGTSHAGCPTWGRQSGRTKSF